MRFAPAGDLAVAVVLGDEISIELNTRVRALQFLTEQKAVPGVVEMVPTFNPLLVYYDPLVIAYDELCATMTELAAQAAMSVLPPSREVEVPCCYDPEFGPDLDAAAERLGLGVDDIVALHAGATYHVYFIGFTPGLAYMMGHPERINLPRLDTPRTKVPPGSIGIGGTQCCIYSLESPGGFRLFGRTPLRLYDPEADEPVLLRAGDRVRLRAITRAEFDNIAVAVATRTYRVVIS